MNIRTDAEKISLSASPNLPRGVLRVKAGTNPNSSSIGTLLYVFPTAFAVVGTVSAILWAAAGPTSSDGEEETEAKEEAEAGEGSEE